MQITLDTLVAEGHKFSLQMKIDMASNEILVRDERNVEPEWETFYGGIKGFAQLVSQRILEKELSEAQKATLQAGTGLLAAPEEEPA